jgi:hypothetical protein
MGVLTYNSRSPLRGVSVAGPPRGFPKRKTSLRLFTTHASIRSRHVEMGVLKPRPTNQFEAVYEP